MYKLKNSAFEAGGVLAVWGGVLTRIRGAFILLSPFQAGDFVASERLGTPHFKGSWCPALGFVRDSRIPRSEESSVDPGFLFGRLDPLLLLVAGILASLPSSLGVVPTGIES